MWAKQFVRGLLSPLSAVKTVFARPLLLVYLPVPVLLSLLFAAVVIYGGTELNEGMREALLSWSQDSLPQWLGGAVEWVIAILIFGLTGIVLWFTFSMIGMVLAAPFLDIMARIVLAGRGTDLIEENFLQAAVRAVKEVSLMFLVKCLLLLIAIFLPLLFPVLAFLFLAIDFFDFSWANLKSGVRFKFRRALGKDLPALLGICLIFYPLMLIPLLNLVAYPFGVIAAAKLTCLEESMKG